jgi:TonB family protein
MTNQALIYHRPSKWPIATALGTAVLIHLLTGSGIAIISVDPITGFATDVTMEQSIGNPILDNSTVSAFRRWRFKPGSPSRVRIPITFLLTGAQY